ncbi:MAG: imidazolonepropionase [Bacteroidetes bacterium]|nr:MAG: imidazolonepropionase [Bacteroidota bacterium]
MSTTLIGPFRQLLPLTGLPERGAIADEQLLVIPEGGVLVAAGKIVAVGKWQDLRQQYPTAVLEEVAGDQVLLPGLVDAHTHICFAGSRAQDFAARNAGKSYLEMAQAGGGIWSTVQHTRATSQDALTALTRARLDRLLANGVTTVEIKSGYGLNVVEELKLLHAIEAAADQHQVAVVPTCLAAHLVPKDFGGPPEAYLQYLLDELVPVIEQEGYCRRFDIFIEQSAFPAAVARPYLLALKERGFALTVHGDQFTTGGSQVAIDCGALSVDHLEVSGEREIAQLANSQVIPVALPGATIGLGCAFAPARRLLNAGCALAIASDWNPGSAPQGNLLLQAAVLATFEKLTTAEVFAGITQRAARALGLTDRGMLATGCRADLVAFPTNDYREILYQQGSLVPSRVWCEGG